jgi:hypothetical protein
VVRCGDAEQDGDGIPTLLVLLVVVGGKGSGGWLEVMQWGRDPRNKYF